MGTMGRRGRKTLRQRIEQQPASLLDEAALKAFEAKIPLDVAAKLFKKAMVVQALRANRGNQSRAARDLHAHRNTLPRVLEVADDVGPQA